MNEVITPAQEESTSAFDVELSERVIYYLQQTCRWAGMMAYFGGGAVLLSVLFMAIKWNDMEAAFYRAYGDYESIAIAVVCGFVIVYALLLLLLYNFTLKVKRGILNQDVAGIQQGVSSLKIYFMLSAVFGGVYIIITAFTTTKLLM